jgi:hypothetical protein
MGVYLYSFYFCLEQSEKAVAMKICSNAVALVCMNRELTGSPERKAVLTEVMKLLRFRERIITISKLSFIYRKSISIVQ